MFAGLSKIVCIRNVFKNVFFLFVFFFVAIKRNEYWKFKIEVRNKFNPYNFNKR